MFRIPDDFAAGPFDRITALAAGIPARVLEGTRFRRLHKGVYCHRDHRMAWSDRVCAARLALPASARTTGATRLQELGLDVGPRSPLHFVVQGDLHLTLEGVFLHRTVKMPRSDDEGASAEAAFIAFCAESRTIDAIKAGCMLLRLELLDPDLIERIVAEESWRRGAAETAYVLAFLDGRCRSLPEAELRTYVVCAGLPVPEINESIELRPGLEVTPDQWYADYEVAVEYEGSQHQEDRGQYNADIDRYATYRRHKVDYELVTKERMRSPRATVRVIHAALASRGYDGPPADFEGLWPTLFVPLSEVVRPLRAA